jgi:hypothetical protein
MVEIVTAPSGEVSVRRETPQDTISRLHKEHYGDKKKETLPTERFAKGPSRGELMLTAKLKGVKYFRILSKEELNKVLEMKASGATDEQMYEQVIKQAVARWKK